MRKRFLMLFIIMALANFMITAVAYAQEVETEDAVVEEEVVAEEVAEEMPFQESPQSSGLEMFARKIVGSGLVDLFIQGGFVMWPMLILVIWALATIIWKIVSLSYAKINIADFLDKVVKLVEEKK